MPDDDLSSKLEQHATGANVHTIRKTLFYLKDPKAKWIVAPMAAEALRTGDWKPLKDRMRRWF